VFVCVCRYTTILITHSTRIHSAGSSEQQRTQWVGARLAVIGPTTAAACREQGVVVHAVAAKPTPAALMQAIVSNREGCGGDVGGCKDFDGVPDVVDASES
jgi:hypothetical protein